MTFGPDDDARCTARSKQTWERRSAWAIKSTNPPRCRHHAGRKSAVIKAEIRAERHLQLAYDRAHAHHNLDPSSDENTLDDLLRIKNDALRWHATCKALLGELREVRYKSRSSGEQLRAEVALWERSLDRAARICADLVRLGIEDRIARVTQAQTEQMAAMLSQLIPSILARGGLDYGTDTVRLWVIDAMAELPGVSDTA